ncbi:MAG: type II 3-dehydroquinate dehydratase [Muribaculaceae bacterium]
MKQIIIINGPNLNLQGRRCPEIYGTDTFDSLVENMRSLYPHIDITLLQSNHEGDIIDWLHAYGLHADTLGIILNAGAYTHTSLAIADAVEAVSAPVVEVHISNIAAREDIRRRSMLAPVCAGSIVGFGLHGYKLAADAIINIPRE